MTTKDEALRLALQALEATLETLDCANAEPGGPIADTIWHTESETLFDYLSDRINVLKQAIGTSGPRVEESADGGHEAAQHKCKLGCIDTCTAREHGCASECPALPGQPTAPAAPADPVAHHPV